MASNELDNIRPYLPPKFCVDDCAMSAIRRTSVSILTPDAPPPLVAVVVAADIIVFGTTAVSLSSLLLPLVVVVIIVPVDGTTPVDDVVNDDVADTIPSNECDAKKSIPPLSSL